MKGFMPKKHSRFSASSSHRWLACPQSVLLSEKAPPQKESEWALEGTKAHKVLEDFLNNPKDYKKLQTYLYKINPVEMVDHALEAAKWIWEKLGEIEGSILHTETKVHLDHLHDELSGTLDAAIVEEFGKLTVIDFKFGQGIAVPAENNPQLIFYAIGLAKQYGFNFAEVELVILQPRAREGDTIKTHVMPMTELLKWEETFAKGVQNALNGGDTVAGEHCRFCPASLICPEISKKALANAQADFNEDTGALSLPDPKGIMPAKLSKMLEAFPLIENWIEVVREYAHNSIERGIAIPGFKVVEKRATRKWLDTAKVEKEAKKKFGDLAFSHDLLSPAQLEKIAGKEWVEPRCSAVSSGTTLVPESDKRQAVNQIQEDFGKWET